MSNEIPRKKYIFIDKVKLKRNKMLPYSLEKQETAIYIILFAFMKSFD